MSSLVDEKWGLLSRFGEEPMVSFQVAPPPLRRGGVLTFGFAGALTDIFLGNLALVASG